MRNIIEEDKRDLCAEICIQEKEIEYLKSSIQEWKILYENQKELTKSYRDLLIREENKDL